MGTKTTVELEDNANEIVEAIKSIKDFDNKKEAINHIIKQFKEHDDDLQTFLELKS